MTRRSSAVRAARLVAVAAILAGACGGGSGDEASPGGQAGVVLDTAPDVEEAVAESTTTTSTTSTTTTTTTTSTTTIAPVVETTPEPDPTSPPTDPISTGVPVGFRPIFDDSGELRANVPAEWFDTDGASDGELRQLAAAPDLEAFIGGYTQQGMILVAGPSASPDSWMDGLATTLGIAEGDGCTVVTTTEYDDGVYTGTEHLMTCGSSETAAHLIGGRNEEGDLFFLLAMVRPSSDVGVRDEIVQSFFFD